jgi:WD40 repeat protein
MRTNFCIEQRILRTYLLEIVGVTSEEVKALVASKNQVYFIKTQLPPTTSRGDTPLPSITETTLSAIQTPTEIQTINYKHGLLGVTDSTGTAIIVCQPPTDDFSVDRSKCTSFKVSTRMEKGWNGIDFHPNNNQAVVASMMNKLISIYDIQTQQISSQFHLPMHPTQAQFISLSSSGEPVLAITEYNHITLWDLRSGNSCIKRLQVRTVDDI